MLEMMPALGPSGFDPGVGSGGIDCETYNPYLAFNAVAGMSTEQAERAVKSDVVAQIVEHELQAPINVINLNIREAEITDRLGRRIKKKVLWSPDFGKSIQDITNKFEKNGQVWDMTDALSDTVVNSQGESWHMIASPDARKEGDDHRLILLHKHYNGDVSEIFVTIQSSRTALYRLFENISGRHFDENHDISNTFISRRAESGDSSITLGDISAHVYNALDGKEKIERQPYLQKLEQQARMSEEEILRRNSEIGRLVRKEVKRALDDGPSVEALGLVAQSIPKWTEMIESVVNHPTVNKTSSIFSRDVISTDRKLFDESVRSSLISSTARSDLIVKPEAVSQSPPRQRRRFLLKETELKEVNEQIREVSEQRVSQVQELRNVITRSRRDPVGRALRAVAIVTMTHQRPEVMPATRNQRLLGGGGVSKDLVRSHNGVSIDESPRDKENIELEGTQDEFIEKFIAPISHGLISLVIRGESEVEADQGEAIESTVDKVNKGDKRYEDKRYERYEESQSYEISHGLVDLVRKELEERDEEMGIGEIEKIEEQILSDSEVWQEIVAKVLGLAVAENSHLEDRLKTSHQGWGGESNKELTQLHNNETVVINGGFKKEPIRVLQKSLNIVLAFNPPSRKSIDGSLLIDKLSALADPPARLDLAKLAGETGFSSSGEYLKDSISINLWSFNFERNDGVLEIEKKTPEVELVEKEAVNLGREIFKILYSKGGECVFKSDEKVEESCDTFQLDSRDSLVRLGVFLAAYSEKDTSQELKSLLSALIYHEVKKLQIEELVKDIPETLPIFEDFEELTKEHGEVFKERFERLVSVIGQMSSLLSRNDRENNNCLRNSCKEFLLNNILFIFYYLISSHSFEKLAGFGRVKRTYFDPQVYNSQISNVSFPRFRVIYDRTFEFLCNI